MPISILWLLAGLMDVSIAQIWAERARAELGAASRFRDLARRLRSVNVPSRIMDLVAKASHDEDRHAVLCAEMAKKLGHPSGFASLETVATETRYSWQSLTSEADILLLDVILMCCVTESMNASLLNSIYTHARQGESRTLIHHILQDEVKHAQIGWAYLGWVSAQRDLSFVSDYLGEMLEIAVHDALFKLIEDTESPDTYALGVMPLEHRRGQFLATLENVVIPGFEHFGIDTYGLSQWRDDTLRMLDETDAKTQMVEAHS